MLVSAVLSALVCKSPAYVPTAAYDVQDLDGWQIHLDRHFKNTQGEQSKKTFALLDTMLKHVIKTMPKDKVDILKKTPIWIMEDSPNGSAMVYHPNRQWLIDHQQNPDKAQCVELSHPDKFLAWSDIQPDMAMHELAHSYHDRVLGFDNKEIKAAYDAAVKSGLYDNVKHANGKMQRHYCLTNPQEFFAEMTESYFGKNDFYPYDREELKKYDPKTYKLIESVWYR